jgi:hypothetical protein
MNAATASPPPPEANAQLSARVAALVERIGMQDPMLKRDFPRERKIVQFRN